MAITRHETQVTWPTAANSLSVGFNSGANSEAITLDPTCIAARVQFKADNAGTPASGDVVEFFWQETHGDPDGAGADEFTGDDAANMVPLGSIDTNATDGASRPAQLPLPQKQGRIRAVSGAASNSIVVSATITETRFA